MNPKAEQGRKTLYLVIAFVVALSQAAYGADGTVPQTDVRAQ